MRDGKAIKVDKETQLKPGLFLELIKDEMEAVEKEIHRQVDSSIEKISTMGRYIIQSGGKRFRPGLLLLTTKLLGKVDDRFIRFASLIELLHTATLVHDDIIDGSDFRRGRQSANSCWGDDISVLMGDFLYIKSIALTLEARNFRVLEILTGITMKMIEGEMIQIEMSRDMAMSEEQYFDIIRRKTAYLFSACCLLPAIMQEATPEQENALEQFGLNIGMAFQLMDDMLDLDSKRKIIGKPVGSDLKEGKLTLPVIYLLERGTAEQINKIKTVLTERSFKNVSREEIYNDLVSYNIIEDTRKIAMAHAEKGVSYLGIFPDSEIKRAMESIPQFFVNRRF
jgi:octaprenyl-diphosphate synthase